MSCLRKHCIKLEAFAAYLDEFARADVTAYTGSLPASCIPKELEDYHNPRLDSISLDSV